MKLPRPWVQMPSDWIRLERKLENFNWKNQDGQKSTALAALELYICICFFSTRQDVAEDESDSAYELVTDLSYSEFSELTGMSRALVSKGLQKLSAENMIKIRANGKKSNSYAIVDFDSHRGWCKLPARALISESNKQMKIVFSHRFTRRSKYELYAVKMFLLLAAHRDNSSLAAMSTFDTITEDAGIPRSEIKRAQTLMLTTDLLEKIDFDREDRSHQKAANQYYLKGYQGFLAGQKPKEEPVATAEIELA